MHLDPFLRDIIKCVVKTRRASRFTFLFFFILHNPCTLLSYWHQRLKVCSVHILIPCTRLQRTMPYMESWTRLPIIIEENVLRSAA